MQTKTICGILALLIPVACIDPYYPNVDKYLDLPVIEGIITNEAGPYTIRVSKSVALENMELKPVSGAVVTLSDDAGAQEILSEKVPGTYQTSISGIRGEIGRKYKVSIEIDGKIFESDFEELTEPVGIDSIYTRYERRNVREGNVDGLQFYIDTKEFRGGAKQFLWNLTETYKFQSEMVLDYIYYEVDSIVENHSDSGRVCWRTVISDETFTASAMNLTENRLRMYPLHYINNLSNRLSEKYSVMVNQYTISEKAYRYWYEIGQLHDEGGSLYTRQPYQVQGNLKNATEPEEIVLGYFMAAGVSQKRIFVERPSFIFNYSECSPVINLYQTSNPWDLHYPLYAMVLAGSDQAFAGLNCFDCRLKGGTETKPDFWEE